MSLKRISFDIKILSKIHYIISIYYVFLLLSIICLQSIPYLPSYIIYINVSSCIMYILLLIHLSLFTIFICSLWPPPLTSPPLLLPKNNVHKDITIIQKKSIINCYCPAYKKNENECAWRTKSYFLDFVINSLSKLQ